MPVKFYFQNGFEYIFWDYFEHYFILECFKNYLSLFVKYVLRLF